MPNPIAAFLPGQATVGASDKASAEHNLPAAFQDVVASHRAAMAVCSDTWQATYDELNSTANRVAHAVLRRGGVQGDRVAILMQHDTPQIAAMLGVLKAGRTVVTLNPADPAVRLGQVMEGAAPELVVADKAHHQAAAAIVATRSRVLCYEDEIARGPTHNPEMAIVRDAIAHLVFTSGSTGRPKGVQQTHGQILHQTAGYTRATELTCEDRLTLLAALSGGQGVCTAWTALLNGAALFPFSIRENTAAGLAAWITDREISAYFSSASLFRHFIATLGDRVRFPRVRVVRLASETATSDDFESFRKHFPKAVFVHTLASSEIGLVSYLRLSGGDCVAEGRIPVGFPVEGIEIRLLDEGGRPVVAGEVGEIVARGRDLSSGYWRDDALTSERYSEASDGTGVRTVRTGDLGRLNRDGMLDFIGRKDSRIKIRGYSIEPQEVEAAIRQVPDVERVVVGPWSEPNGPPLLVAHVIARGPQSAQSLRKAIRTKLPGYMVPSAFVFVHEFPLTPHGKVDRARLATLHPPVRTVALHEYPLTDTEQRLASVWEQVFDLVGIGGADDFFDLGGDSLIAAVMSARLQEVLGLELQLETFFDHPVLSDLARVVDELRRAKAHAIAAQVEPQPRVGPLPLTYNQESFWHVAQTPASAAALTMSGCSRISGPLDLNVLSRCISTIVRRHEILRTSFSKTDERLIQIVHPPVDVPLPLRDFNGDPDAEAKAMQVWKAEAARVFDLTKPPLIFFALVRLRDDEHWLVYTAHGILVDALSWSLFFCELARHYEAVQHPDTPPLAASPPQYGEYAVWQRQSLDPNSDRYRAMLGWWMSYLLAASYPDHPAYQKALLWCMKVMHREKPLLKKTLGWLLRSVLMPPLPPRHELPFKWPHPKSGVDPGAGLIRWGIQGDVARRLNELGRQQGATGYVTRLAGFVATLAAETGDPTVVLHTALSNRDHPATRGLLGCCATAVMLIFTCDGQCSFRELLAAVGDRMRTMQRHAELPFDTVYRELRAWKIKMPRGRAIFAISREHPVVRCGGIEISQRLDRFVSVVPPTFNVLLDATNEQENCSVVFDAGIYDPARVRRFIDRLTRVLDVVSHQPDIKIDAAIALADGRSARS